MNPLRDGTLSIVLVEDDDADALAIGRALKKARIAVTLERAVDGIEALELLKGHKNGKTVSEPFILLVDLNMPRTSGLELIRALRDDAQLRRTVVFVLTTSRREEDRRAAYDLNVAGYIDKETASENLESLISFLATYNEFVDLP